MLRVRVLMDQGLGFMSTVEGFHIEGLGFGWFVNTQVAHVAPKASFLSGYL